MGTVTAARYQELAFLLMDNLSVSIAPLFPDCCVFGAKNRSKCLNLPSIYRFFGLVWVLNLWRRRRSVYEKAKVFRSADFGGRVKYNPWRDQRTPNGTAAEPGRQRNPNQSAGCEL